MKNLDQLVVALLPDGPCAFDGKHYLYSKGERIYIDDLSRKFKKVILFTFAFREGHPYYESCSHSPFESPNVVVHELPLRQDGNYSIVGKAIHLMQVFWHLLKGFREIDLAYLFLPSYHSALGWVVAKLYRKKHMVYAADDWQQASEGMFKWPSLKNSAFYSVYLKLNTWLEKTIVKGAEFSVTAGQALYDKYLTLGKNIYFTTPRMTLRLDDIVVKDNTRTQDPVQLLNIGSLIFDKAQHVLLESVALLKRRGILFHLKIVGDGEREAELKQLCITLDIQNEVTFCGYVQDESLLKKYFMEADVFILSSVSEGFPRVLYEAMAFSTPIVTTDCGGITGLMKHRKNAMVTTTNDAVVIADAAQELIENDAFRAELTLEARKTVTKALSSIDPEQIPKLVNQYILHAS